MVNGWLESGRLQRAEDVPLGHSAPQPIGGDYDPPMVFSVHKIGDFPTFVLN